MTPRFSMPIETNDGLEPCWGINYLANFQLLSILSPALRAQPHDRDVRIVLTTCAGYVGGDLGAIKDTKWPLPKGREYETSKLALMCFGYAFQSLLDSYDRPDKKPNNARILIVDPGFSRTPGMRRWLTMGSLWGLLVYLMMWPFWWLILKSPDMGCQSILGAVMDSDLNRRQGGRFIKECKEAKLQREEITDKKVAKELWSFSERQIAALEKESALRRGLALQKRNQEQKQDRRHEVPGVTAGASALWTSNNDRDAIVASRRGRTSV
ncbi:MAG: hypothetical protein MMC23_010129 [Stictis urceolatum]|nr:hypothetical protein [Stictis urceolata]